MNGGEFETRAQAGRAVDVERAVPVYFDGAFGWLHPGSSSRGVVLCGPNGYEELCCHRPWLRFAEALSRAGLTTLRFDYPGAGDSASDDAASGRVAAWRKGIESAVAFLRARPGITEVCLVGLRLGATLALDAAQRLAGAGSGVDALVLMAPCVTGKAYYKELRMAAMMARSRRPGDAPARDYLEAAGTFYSAETVAALKALDPAAREVAPAPRVLVLDRAQGDSGGNAGAVVEAIRKTGVAVDEAPFPGYPDMMAVTERAQYPAEDLAPVVTWLARGQAPASSGSAPPAPIAEPVLDLPEAREVPVWLDGANPLFGIRTEPRDPASHRTAVLILNTAANHHVGTYRVSVQLARRLGAAGIASFRVNHGGVGDSPSVPGRPDNAFDRVDLVPDVRRCVDYLAAEGYREIVVYGLCSGAWLGWHAALEDPRITGLIMLNLQNLWQGSRVARMAESNRSYLRLLREPRTWLRLVKGEIAVRDISRVLMSRLWEAATARLGHVTGKVTGSESVADRARREFRALAVRGTRTALIYVGTDTGIDELELHFGRYGQDLADEPGLEMIIIPEGDHLFSTRASRDELMALMAGLFRDGRFTPSGSVPAREVAAPAAAGSAPAALQRGSL